jgi:itaconyl-CoA hydratase
MAGLFFEDFTVGSMFDHDSARSVTSFDNIWYSCMTLNTQPLHSNFDFSERHGLYKKPLFNSMYTLSIVVGQTGSDLTQGTLLRVLALEDIEFPRPTFAGDTLYSRTTVQGKIEGGADAAEARAGTIELFHEGRNQHGELIASCKRTVLVRKKPSSI